MSRSPPSSSPAYWPRSRGAISASCLTTARPDAGEVDNLDAVYQSGLIGLILIAAVLMQNVMLRLQQQHAAASD